MDDIEGNDGVVRNRTHLYCSTIAGQEFLRNPRLRGRSLIDPAIISSPGYHVSYSCREMGISGSRRSLGTIKAREGK